MSPILVRPVREQLEHDRVIRLLQAKYKRKFDVSVNFGNEQTTPVGAGPLPWYPDLVLHSQEKSRKVIGVVEVETAESVNHLEAMSQWAAFSKVRAPFHLYVPSASVDAARRLCAGLQIVVTEIWAYQWMGDQMRFTLVHRTQPTGRAKARTAGEAPTTQKRTAPARRAAARPARVEKAAAKVRTSDGRPARRAAATPAKARKTAVKPRSSASVSRPKSQKKASSKSAAARPRPSKKPASRAQKRR